MDKVLTIHLAGTAYTFEEEAYGILKTYLSDARRRLDGNPDAEEIVSDIERAIGEKCEGYLMRNKNVILVSEIQKILAEIGEVKETDAAGSDHETNNAETPKKLYRIRNGAIISGVANGFAAYFNMDVSLMRFIFILCTVIAHGLGIIAYFILVLILPVAETPEARAEAFGTPLTAEAIMKRAQEEYAQMRNSERWKKWSYRWKRRKQDEWIRPLRQERRMPSFWGRFIREVVLLIEFAAAIFVCYYGYHHSIAVKEFFDGIGNLLQQTDRWLSAGAE
ncbi:MAG: PspC domain-containing protein [Patescibacteria group bacterium]|nr:PspC domain-containing protein [Patescibacteria group bacterium]